VEEPQLRQDERSGQNGRRDDAERRDHQRHQRHEPDEVLRRHEARKGHEARNRCGSGGDKTLRAARAPRKEPGHEQDGGDLHDAHRDRERVRQRSGEVSRERKGRSANDLGVVETQAMRGQKERAAEALDLERPLGLGLRALPEAVPAEQRERADDGQHDRGERQDRSGQPTPPDGQAENGKQRSRIDLRGEGEPE
jgi:hypothetical protein